jgi:hypothetical protein
MAAALPFISTLANDSLLSVMISTLDASATFFMNSPDASVVNRILLSPDIENVYGQGLEFDTSLLCSLWSPAHSSPRAIDCISRGKRAFLMDQQSSELNSIPKIGSLQQSKPSRLI